MQTIAALGQNPLPPAALPDYDSAVLVLGEKFADPEGAAPSVTVFVDEDEFEQESD